jgi:hypothetical protein
MGLDAAGTTISPGRSRRDLALGFEARHPAHGAGDADPKTLGCRVARHATFHHGLHNAFAKIVRKRHPRRLLCTATIFKQIKADSGIPRAIQFARRPLYIEARDDLRAIADFFASLKPATEEQRELVGAAKQAFARIVETTLLMARQLANPVPLLLMAVVVGWSALLFFCFGPLATFSWISLLAQILGSLAVAAAFFMILEFSTPYSGLFRISPVGVDSLIKSMGG